MNASQPLSSRDGSRRGPVGRVGLQVFRFDVNGTTMGNRLRWADLIQTPGEGGFVHLWEENSTIPNNPQIYDPYDVIGFVRDPEGVEHKKLLFVGDSMASFRILTYGSEE